MKILFLCKRRVAGGYTRGSYGLANSAQFVVDALNREYAPTHTAEMETVVDANGIDREVAESRPDVVILEALWVTPDKLRELSSLHPSVKWIVRGHSKATFLAQEGIALAWMREYNGIPRVFTSVNNQEFHDDLFHIGIPAIYLPNVYFPASKPSRCESMESNDIHVGCFGALRLLKNHLGQAIAAMRFANDLNRRLVFHINSSAEDVGASVLKNLDGLFRGSEHVLAKHEWLPHSQFLQLVSCMDLGMQVSCSESFNIVAADFIHAGVPIVTSKEVKHVHWLFRCNNTTAEMVRALKIAWYVGHLGLNESLLSRSNAAAIQEWGKLVTMFA